MPLTLTGSAALEARVRDLLGRERRCCSFFTFTVATDPPPHLVLDIAVQPAHVEVLDALHQRLTDRACR